MMDLLCQFHQRVKRGLRLGILVEQERVLVRAPAQVVHRAPYLHRFDAVGVTQENLHQVAVILRLLLQIFLVRIVNAHVKFGHAQEQITLGNLLERPIHAVNRLPTE